MSEHCECCGVIITEKSFRCPLCGTWILVGSVDNYGLPSCRDDREIQMLQGICERAQHLFTPETKEPCPECAEREESKRKWGVYPCEQCAAKNKEIARLTAENASLTELIGINRDQLAKIARLTTLVAVGREMADAYVRCMDIGDKHFKTYATGPGRALVARWRSLEGT